MGLNEAAGYGAVAITALATGYIAASHGLRPGPFLLGAAYIALGLSAVLVRETRGHAQLEASRHQRSGATGDLSTRDVVLTSFRGRALSAASQAGMVNNLNDGLAWGIFPVLFADHGLSVGRIGVLAALYPAVCGAAQLGTGALSDRWGRKWLIATGMWVQAAAIGIVARGDDLRRVGCGCSPARARHRRGLSDAARRGRRRGTSGLAGTCGRCTGSGVTAGSPSERSSPASSPTPSG